MREICWKCTQDHPKHHVIDKTIAISEFTDKYREFLLQINEELKGSGDNKKDLSKVIEGEEDKLSDRVDKVFEVFTKTEEMVKNEEIECITKTLQEMEFKAPSRIRLEIEKRELNLHEIVRIGRPILKQPVKNTNKPLHILKVAELTLQRYKEKKTGNPLQIIMKAPLQEFSLLKHGFLFMLSDKFDPQSVGMLFAVFH